MSRTEKTTVNRYQPWPEEAKEPYQELERLLEVLMADITVSIERGLKQRNKFVVAELAPFVSESVSGIGAACQHICGLLPDNRRGRFPRWFTSTLEIQAIIIDIQANLLEVIEPALSRNELIYLRGVYDCLKTEAGKIKSLLAENPYRTDSDALAEAARIVNREWER